MTIPVKFINKKVETILNNEDKNRERFGFDPLNITQSAEIRKAYENGFFRGYEIAEYVDIPEVGEEIDEPGVDLTGKVENIEFDGAEVFMIRFYESETVNREYSPFEFTAKELNDLEEELDIDLWVVFDEGITDGAKHYWKEQTGYDI